MIDTKKAKLSRDQIEALRSLGVLTDEDIKKLDEAHLTPSRPGPNSADRQTDVERMEVLSKILEDATPDERKTYLINVCKLIDNGYPSLSVVTPTYWSSIAPGSMVAWSLGYVSALRVTRILKGTKTTDHFEIKVELRPITKDDHQDRLKSWVKAQANKRHPKPLPIPKGITWDDAIPQETDKSDNATEE